MLSTCCEYETVVLKGREMLSWAKTTHAFANASLRLHIISVQSFPCSYIVFIEYDLVCYIDMHVMTALNTIIMMIELFRFFHHVYASVFTLRIPPPF